MKIRIFQSGKGDCLLLTGEDGVRVLVDGGKLGAYREHVAPFLGGLKEDDESLDVVYVSHIDADHIEGVLELVDDLVEWRVHRHQLANGNPTHPEPDAPEPPQPGEIWNNAFHDVMGENAGPIADMFAAMAHILTSHDEPEFRDFATGRQDLATSQKQALLLSRRIGPNQLGIDLNLPAAGKLLFAHEGQPSFARGSLEFFTLGPFEEDLETLRAEWNAWLNNNTDVLEDIREEMDEDEADLLGNAVNLASIPLVAVAQALGDRGSVTTPNLASLMFLVEEDGKTVLLTGDGHSGDIVKGLQGVGKLVDGGGVHVDVLKVQHHGSEHNVDRDFAKTVTADHYVFCGDGSHHNPDLEVMEVLLESRLGEGADKSSNAEVDQPFRLWFSSSPDLPLSATKKTHMEEVKKLVRRYQQRVPGRLRYSFLTRSSREFEV